MHLLVEIPTQIPCIPAFAIRENFIRSPKIHTGLRFLTLLSIISGGSTQSLGTRLVKNNLPEKQHRGDGMHAACGLVYWTRYPADVDEMAGILSTDTDVNGKLNVLFVGLLLLLTKGYKALLFVSDANCHWGSYGVKMCLMAFNFRLLTMAHKCLCLSSLINPLTMVLIEIIVVLITMATMEMMKNLSIFTHLMPFFQ